MTSDKIEHIGNPSILYRITSKALKLTLLGEEIYVWEQGNTFIQWVLFQLLLEALAGQFHEQIKSQRHVDEEINFISFVHDMYFNIEHVWKLCSKFIGLRNSGLQSFWLLRIKKMYNFFFPSCYMTYMQDRKFLSRSM